MVEHVDERQRYLDARKRASEASRATATFRSRRHAAEIEAARSFERLLRQAEQSDDATIRRAAAEVRTQRIALRDCCGAVARSLVRLIDRLVASEADALGFGEDADLLVQLAIDGRSSLLERHLAVGRAESVLDDLRVRPVAGPGRGRPDRRA